LLLGSILSFALSVPVSAGAQQDDFDAAITGLAENLAPALAGKTVAVFEFPDLEGRTSNLSRMVSEQLTTELVQQLGGGGTIVERRQVIQVLAELKLQRTDLTADEVTRVGRQLGADAIVLGSVTVLGAQLVVNARAVTVDGGRVVSAGRRNVRGSSELLALAQSGYDVTPLTGRRTGDGVSSTASSNTAAGRTLQASVPPEPKRLVETPRLLEERSGPVTLKLNRCTHQRGSIRCEGMVISTEDHSFAIQTMGFPEDQIFAYTRMIDEEGGIHVLSSGSFNVELVAGVPVRVVLEFQGVPASKKIPLIELRIWSENRSGVMRFRDVPVQ
jgi:TolB-like protein